MVAHRRVKPTKLNPVAGEVFGKLRIIQRVTDKQTKTANLRVQVRVECECGQRLTIPYFYLIRSHIPPKKDCGSCKPTSLRTQHRYTLRSWYMMNVRCTNPRHIAWEHYGGRGISVDPRWSWDNPRGFENFLEDMGPRPHSLTLDRIDNDGNYTPTNCRWATAVQQRANQRPRT